jgi:hypothetical protein
MKRRTGFPVRVVFGVLVLFSAPVFAQIAPGETGLGRDYEGRAIAAVLPLAGNETEMNRRFEAAIMEAVRALEKYSPRKADFPPGMEIPTDMPPLPGLVNGARYALTGGVYPGDRVGEYFLQLWLWDMAGSTMIYTDDLVYDDIEGTMESLPGLVEWLFSHIHETVIETPELRVPPDPLLMIGFRIGLAPRWYIKPGEISAGAQALNLEGGVSGALRLSSLFSLQLEFLLTGDTLVYRGLNQPGYVMANKKYTNLSLTIPLLFKVNLRAGIFRLSPLGGFYIMAPLGQTRYRLSTGGGNLSYSWFYTVPLGFTIGLEGSREYGPGRIFAGLRYGLDFGRAVINGGQERRTYTRQSFSLYVGYEFGFFNGKKLGGLL